MQPDETPDGTSVSPEGDATPVDLRLFLTDANQVVHGTILGAEDAGDDDFAIDMKDSSGKEFRAVVHSKNGRTPKEGESWNFMAGKKLDDPEVVHDDQTDTDTTYAFDIPVGDKNQ